ncbi:MAG: hypothetical protein IJX58_07065 [Clostridia bacterium]|nr:hypothetical protein [Clostridia bacterium]
MKDNNSNKNSNKIVAWLKERVRKFFVALKKNPQAIPLVALCITFVQYSMNLTSISDTTAKIQGANMGLAAFVSMLFMILSFVCMLNAFPKRQKPKIAMMALMVVLYAAVIFADIHYIGRIDNALNNPTNSFNEAALEYINTAKSTLSIHVILVGITTVLMLLEPVLAKLLKKINTSIDVEGSGDIGTIEIADEE